MTNRKVSHSVANQGKCANRLPEIDHDLHIGQSTLVHKHLKHTNKMLQCSLLCTIDTENEAYPMKTVLKVAFP